MRIRIKDKALMHFFGVECEVVWIDGREFIGNDGERFPLNQLIASSWEKIIDPVETFTARYNELMPVPTSTTIYGRNKRKEHVAKLYEAGMRFVPDQEESDLLSAIDHSPSPTPRANILARVLWEAGWRKVEP